MESNLFVKVGGLWINRLGDEHNPSLPEPTLTVYDSFLHGGGTHNAGNYSPDGSRIAAFADVGGIRYHSAADGWRYTVTNAANADRQVAGGIIMNDGTIIALVGNGTTSGKLIQVTPAGVWSDLVTGLYVAANSPGDGDPTPRPRPVGNMVAFDATNNLVYVCEQDGVLRYNRTTFAHERIALEGVSCRGFAHTNDGHVNNADTLVVCTDTVGLVKLFGVKVGNPAAVRISDQAWDRFEDAAVITGDKLLCSGHSTGVYRYDATGAVTLSGSNDIDGPVVDVPVAVSDSLSLVAELNCAWSTAAFTIIGNWDTTLGAAGQQHRLQLTAGGRLTYSMRDTAGSSGAVNTSTGTAISLADNTRGFVRVARTFGSNQVVFSQSTDGVNWTTLHTASLSAATLTKSLAWSIGGTNNGNDRAPSGTIFYRAWVRHNGVSKVSFDATGLVTGATTYQSLENGVWTLNGTVTVGGVNVTPSQNDGVGANGGSTLWITGACINNAGTVRAAIGYVNPDTATEWIYRALNVETVTSATGWDNATPTAATQAAGSTYLQPPNRILGQSGASGAGLTGVYYLAFDPSDTTGNTLFVSGALAVYRSTNFAGTLASITFTTYQAGLSMVSAVDACVDAAGNLLIAASDHNSLMVASASAFTVEPTRIGVSGIGDAWGIASVGSGANKVTVLCPADDGDPLNANHDVFFHKGSAVPNSWTSTGFLAALGVHRPGGVYGWDNANGTYTFVVWGDGTGWSRATYTVGTNTWGTWTSDTGTPTTTTQDQNQVRPLTGKANGSVLWGIELLNGRLYRYSGGSWSIRHSPAFGTSQQVRAGRLAYWEAGDWLILSDNTGLFRVSTASGTSTLTKLTGISSACIVAVDADGLAYAHVRKAGVGHLYRFANFGTATSTADAVDIANNEYATRCPDLATQMVVGTINGTKTGVTLYQGSGVIGWN